MHQLLLFSSMSHKLEHLSHRNLYSLGYSFRLTGFANQHVAHKRLKLKKGKVTWREPPSKINSGSGKFYLLRQERISAKEEWLHGHEQGVTEASKSAPVCWELNSNHADDAGCHAMTPSPQSLPNCPYSEKPRYRPRRSRWQDLPGCCILLTSDLCAQVKGPCALSILCVQQQKRLLLED